MHFVEELLLGRKKCLKFNVFEVVNFIENTHQCTHHVSL